MKKTTLALALALLAFAAAPAAAQQKVKIKTKTNADAAPAPDAPAAAPAAQGPVSAAASKSIPVAEYYEGGQEAMYAFINKELKYPLMARRNRIQGTCIVSFTLNPDGTMSGMKLIKNIGGGCGEEALRVVRLLQFKKPEYPILTSLPIPFKLGSAASNATE